MAGRAKAARSFAPAEDPIGLGEARGCPPRHNHYERIARSPPARLNARLAAATPGTRPSAMPSWNRSARAGQGVTSKFAFGRPVGQIEGVLAALAIPVSYMPTVSGKKAMSVPKVKDSARPRASELLPVHAERWQLARHDNRAEAALIALWTIMHLPAEPAGRCAHWL